MFGSAARKRVLAFALIVGAFGFSSHSASAQFYGAIGFSQSTGALGWGFDYQTQGAAEEAALFNCRKYASDCVLAIWFKNGCGAIAAGEGGGYGTAFDASKAEAERLAMLACRSLTRQCSVIRWVCTTKSSY